MINIGEPWIAIPSTGRDQRGCRRLPSALSRSTSTIDSAHFAFGAQSPGSPSAPLETTLPPWPRSLTLDQILGANQHISINLGERWGFLRIFPPATMSPAIDILA